MSPSIPASRRASTTWGQAYGEGLLFLGDVGVLVTPVIEQLLLLTVVDPHDLSGRGLDDVLELSQVIHSLKGRFLQAMFKSSISISTCS